MPDRFVERQPARNAGCGGGCRRLGARRLRRFRGGPGGDERYFAAVGDGRSGERLARRLSAAVQKLAPTSGLLLIVCGNEGSIDEEIQVRQLGAWLYLPGVSDGDSVSLLCSEARHITERMKPTLKPGGRRRTTPPGRGSK